MKLYFAPGTCALAVHIVLKWIGKPFEAEQVEMGSAAYKKINPLGAVPALAVDGYRLMTQVDAILNYLNASFPEATLGPNKDADALAHFEMNETLAFLGGDFHPAFFPFFVPNRFTTSQDAGAQDAVREAAKVRIDQVMTHLNQKLEQSVFLVGDRRSMADPYAFAMTRWTEATDKPWQEYPAVRRFMEHMHDDDGVIAAMQAQGLI